MSPLPAQKLPDHTEGTFDPIKGKATISGGRLIAKALNNEGIDTFLHSAAVMAKKSQRFPRLLQCWSVL